VEENKIIFPNQVVWKKVKTGRDSDRVFILKFTSGDERSMFWMQDKVNINFDSLVLFFLFITIITHYYRLIKMMNY
jgi:hypothetical protein